VEKDQFVTLLRNYTALTREEADNLIAIQSQFPYSQVVHNLCSRAAQDLGLSAREELLHKSAVYTTERSALKSIMTATPSKRVVIESTLQQNDIAASPIVEKSVKTVLATNAPVIVQDASILNSTLWNDLLDDMKRLEESKTRFEETIARLESGLPPLEVAEIKTVKPVKEEMEKPKETSSLAQTADNIIEEIKSKKKVGPENPKQKEQIEIIDKFIKTKPSITRVKPEKGADQSQDLAEESLAEGGDHIVSETLVELLLKQGRKDKAIEVLKKLIWKIPQKKAYFAAQIEELKK
jgi:tetratricopeptide (TPR) repeat protein